MPYYKFEENDLFHSVIKTHPSCEFFVYSASVYYNNKLPKSGQYSNLINHVSGGFVNLYELNVDRQTDSIIYPFITKAGSLSSFKSLSTEEFNLDFLYGDILTGSYPLSASVTREYFRKGLPQNFQFAGAAAGEVGDHPDSAITKKFITNPQTLKKSTKTDVIELQKKHILALENTLNYYTNVSPHYIFSSSANPITKQALDNHAWNKANQELTLISIPSIFYGSSIKKGSVSLKFYTSGSLLAELQDKNRNGELIEITASNDSRATGSVAGVVLYKEGFIVLTGSWNLTSSGHKEEYVKLTSSLPQWVHFGTGMNDQSGSFSNPLFLSMSSFHMAFSGTNQVPTMTMLAHAKRGELNHSNNPTYIKFGQKTGSYYATGSEGFYKEPDNVKIKNTISSSYGCDFTGSFKKQTFINKIGIYDENKNLIAIAKMATPVRKLETDEYTFKLKLDF